MDSAIEGVKYYKAGYAYCENNHDQDFIVASNHHQTEVKKYVDERHTIYSVPFMEIAAETPLGIFNEYLRKIGAID